MAGPLLVELMVDASFSLQGQSERRAADNRIDNTRVDASFPRRYECFDFYFHTLIIPSREELISMGYGISDILISVMQSKWLEGLSAREPADFGGTRLVPDWAVVDDELVAEWEAEACNGGPVGPVSCAWGEFSTIIGALPTRYSLSKNGKYIRAAIS
jgi:hypothetical protein